MYTYVDNISKRRHNNNGFNFSGFYNIAKKIMTEFMKYKYYFYFNLYNLKF